LGDRLSELEQQRDMLGARLSEEPPPPVRLHPKLADIYAEKVQGLDASLNDPAIRQEAAEALRSLIDRIELSPRKEGEGLGAVLHGDLAHILALCEAPNGKQKLPEKHISGSLPSVVAGA
jgi:site-specific DNA recombinase